MYAGRAGKSPNASGSRGTLCRLRAESTAWEVRVLKIHEYQAKVLMKQRGIAVPLGRVAATVEEAVAAVRPLVEESGNPVVVVKSQIHAGGRGKGRFVEHPDVAGVNVVTAGIKGVGSRQAKCASWPGRCSALPSSHPDRSEGGRSTSSTSGRVSTSTVSSTCPWF